MNKYLVVTSFGTTHKDTLEKNITKLENNLQNTFRDWKVKRAFTSNKIIKILKDRGENINDLPTILNEAKEKGIEDIAVLPTHLLYGEEYEKMCRQVILNQDYFKKINIGKPLFASTQDLLAISEILSSEYPRINNKCIVFMGHGTNHYVNTVYTSLEYMLRQIGRDDIFIGTVESYPGIEQVLNQLKNKNFKKVLLAPLMFVAGDHAKNDMAGLKDNSWKSIFTKNNFEVDIVLKGLGEIELVNKVYENHVIELLGNFNS